MRALFGGSLVACGALGLFGVYTTPGASAQQAEQGQPGVQQPMRPNESVYNVLMSDPQFSTTIKMVYAAGRARNLQSVGPVTVFAATDTGWDAGNYSGLTWNQSSTSETQYPDGTDITKALRGFFMHGEPTLNSAADVRMESAAGRPIEFNKNTMTVRWVAPDGETRSAKVVGVPIIATNGVIYPVNAVVGG